MAMPQRKPTRLKEYDYNTAGAYFLTVCVKDRRQLLGEIVGRGDFDAPKMVLSAHGDVLDRYIRTMSRQSSLLTIDKYVIMPNHFHMLVTISGASASAAPYNSEIAKFISLLKRYCNREYGQNIWQRSYHDHIVRDKANYDAIWEYIADNPRRWREDTLYCE